MRQLADIIILTSSDINIAKHLDFACVVSDKKLKNTRHVLAPRKEDKLIMLINQYEPKFIIVERFDRKLSDGFFEYYKMMKPDIKILLLKHFAVLDFVEKLKGNSIIVRDGKKVDESNYVTFEELRQKKIVNNKNDIIFNVSLVMNYHIWKNVVPMLRRNLIF